MARILWDTAMYRTNFKAPQIADVIDGVWHSKISCTNEISLAGIRDGGKHESTVYLIQSQQMKRWGSLGKSGLNVLRLTGLQRDSDIVGEFQNLQLAGGKCIGRGFCRRDRQSQIGEVSALPLMAQVMNDREGVAATSRGLVDLDGDMPPASPIWGILAYS